MEALTPRPLVVCTFLWGTWPGGDASYLGPYYVETLRRAVYRRCKTQHRFVCFADAQRGNMLARRCPGMEFLSIGNSPLVTSKGSGNLAKLKAFDLANGFSGHQVLVFDLDTIIIADIAAIANYRGRLAMRADWAPPYPRVMVPGGDLISFNADAMAHIWTEATQHPERTITDTGGSERRFWRLREGEKIDYWQEVAPGKVVSFKRHCAQPGRRTTPPDGAAVVSCHGRPKPHDIAEYPQAEWAREAWGIPPKNMCRMAEDI